MSRTSQRLLFLELNEVNFDNISFYAARGQLPNFRKLLDRSGVQMTISEQRYEHLEPWIQWVTAHTGMSFSAHGVFRLGDIVKQDIPQIWERLEELGLRVGAISPMNAKHRLRSPAFFVPDPWTSTDITAPRRLVNLYKAITQAVNDNASGKIAASSIRYLLQGILAYARPRNFARYAALALGAKSHPWRKSMFLDLLLVDVFIKEVRRTQPHFATLFLNSAAHIQHHYMFSSACYSGPLRNPSWYAPKNADPLLEVYELYDAAIGAMRAAFPDARLMLATGLHQVPHEEVTYYWRLKDHATFLRQIGVGFERVEPRMSRDFLITCSSSEAASRAAERLAQARGADGTSLFEVDNRGKDVFAMLVYPREIPLGFEFSINAEVFRGLEQQVAFVAIKNGEHNGIGYFVDSEASEPASPLHFPLRELPLRVLAAFGQQSTLGNELPT